MGGRRVRRPQRQQRQPGCILQFLVAAVAALALGYSIGTFMLSQQGKSLSEDAADEPALLQSAVSQKAPTVAEEPENGPQPLVSISMPEFSLFQVQVGSFAQKDNAERLAQKFLAEKVPVETISAAGLTQVRVGLFLNRFQAENFRDQISSEVLRPLVVEKKIASRELNFDAADGEYARFLATVIESTMATLRAAEEGPVESAVAELDELTSAAANIGAASGKKQGLVEMLENIRSNLLLATKGPAEQRPTAVGSGIAAFLAWCQELGSVD